MTQTLPSGIYKEDYSYTFLGIAMFSMQTVRIEKLSEN